MFFYSFIVFHYPLYYYIYIYYKIYRERSHTLQKNKLTQMEKKVMYILWQNPEPLLISDIVSIDTSLPLTSVQRLMRNLLEKDYVEVVDIVQSGKVFGRRYRAKKMPDDIIYNEVENFLPVVKNKIHFSKRLIASLLNNEENEKETLDELEDFIKMQKRSLEQHKDV